MTNVVWQKIYNAYRNGNGVQLGSYAVRQVVGTVENLVEEIEKLRSEYDAEDSKSPTDRAANADSEAPNVQDEQRPA